MSERGIWYEEGHKDGIRHGREQEQKRIKRIIKQYHKKDECECKFTDNPLCYWKELLLRLEGDKE